MEKWEMEREIAELKQMNENLERELAPWQKLSEDIIENSNKHLLKYRHRLPWIIETDVVVNAPYMSYRIVAKRILKA